MSLEGFIINVWFALPFGGFYSPDNSNATLVFGVGNSGCHSTPFIETSMNTMSLRTWIKIEGRESYGSDIQVADLGFYGHVDDRVDRHLHQGLIGLIEHSEKQMIHRMLWQACFGLVALSRAPGASSSVEAGHKGTLCCKDGPEE